MNANAAAISTETVRATASEGGLQTGINNTNVRCGNIESDVTRFKNVTADNFSSVNGKIGNLQANVANISSLVATKASISDLQATNARVDNLQANMITARQVDARIVNTLTSYSGNLFCSNIWVGGTRFTGGKTIGYESGSGLKFVTVLST